MTILRAGWHLLMAFGLLIVLAGIMTFSVLCAWDEDWKARAAW